MTKVIVEKKDSKSEVYNGQIREDEDGRIVMVITDNRYEDYVPTQAIRALVLRESDRGFADPFTTIPMMFKDDEQLARMFPKVLRGTITIEEE